jgi:hypothetical protein
MNECSTESRDIRKFGAVVAVFFGVLSISAVWAERSIPLYFFGSLSLLGLGFLLVPARLKPVYIGWQKAARRIGMAVTMTILTLFYVLVMTPAAFLKKRLGGPPLPLKPDPAVPTYWVARREPAQPKERFAKRY